MEQLVSAAWRVLPMNSKSLWAQQASAERDEQKAAAQCAIIIDILAAGDVVGNGPPFQSPFACGSCEFVVTPQSILNTRKDFGVFRTRGRHDFEQLGKFPDVNLDAVHVQMDHTILSNTYLISCRLACRVFFGQYSA